MFALALHALWSWSIIKRAILASGPKGSYILTYGQVSTSNKILPLHADDQAFSVRSSLSELFSAHSARLYTSYGRVVALS